MEGSIFLVYFIKSMIQLVTEEFHAYQHEAEYKDADYENNILKIIECANNDAQELLEVFPKFS